MAVLSETTLEAGRILVRAKDMKGLMDWLDVNEIVINRKVFRETMTKVFNAGQIDNAIKLFNAAFVGCDPAVDKLTKRVGGVLIVCIILFRIMIGLLILAAGLGGALYLYRAVFG